MLVPSGHFWHCLCGILVLLSSTQAASNIRTNGIQLVDDVGRVVVLRGLNLPINAKLPDFMPLKNKTALEALPLYGTTIARVLFSWEAFEPERGQYSMDYLDYYLGLVEALKELGVLTIVDMHQDFYSRYLNKGCGEGFPRWAVLVPQLLQKPPLGGVYCIAWILQGPLDAASWLNWSLFYAGEGGVRDRFLDLWEYLAQTFADNPAVIGYDLLNEPFGDEVTEIGPLYQDVAQRIRKHDPDGILFIEPQIYAGGGGTVYLPQPNFTNYVLASHYYGQTRKYGIVTPFAEALAKWMAMTRSWNAPLFFGEFGANNDPNPDIQDFQAPNYINMFYDTLDAHLLGGTQWGWTDDFNPATHDGWNMENFSIVDQRRDLRSNYAVRPCPRAIAGVPGLFKVDTVKKSMVLSWQVTADTLASGAASGGRGATTEVFAPIQGFFTVATAADLLIQGPSPVLACSYSADGLYIACVASQEGNYTLTISIKPS